LTTSLSTLSLHDALPISLTEDVLDLVEDRGPALRGLVFDFERCAELLHQFALLARELGGRKHADVIVQIAAAAAVRIRQAFPLEDRKSTRLNSSHLVISY